MFLSAPFFLWAVVVVAACQARKANPAMKNGEWAHTPAQKAQTLADVACNTIAPPWQGDELTNDARRAATPARSA